jgi:glutamine amidotransferase
MSKGLSPVVIVDYGMGNLFSVAQACQRVGLATCISSSAAAVRAAPAIILPGVGAFGDAMRTLGQLGLDEAIVEVAGSGRPVFGICLGMQLLMTTSYEFGSHAGLNLVRGDVVRLEHPVDGERALKVPQVGWNRVWPPKHRPAAWSGTLFDDLPAGEFLYFVHSFRVRVEDRAATIATTTYGDIEFCAALGTGNVFGCQAHPERSGNAGLGIYRSFARQLRREWER